MAAQTNIINDLGTFTKIPNKVLAELIKKENLCIGSAIHDAVIAQEESAVLNIGIGSLCVDTVGMQCKFIPSKELKSTIKKCITDKVDPLEFEVEESIINKLLELCEEVI